jgi:hypothetical protein
MGKNFKKIFSIILVLTILFDVVVFTKKTFLKKKDDLININELSQEFMDNYFEEVSNVPEENKENMLIVTSKDKLKDTYGATKIIEVPNHQYFLQYESEDEKNEALKKFESDDSDVSVTENIIRKAYEDTVLVSSYNSWGVEAMGIDTLLEKLKNKELNDVVVAILDTGLDVELFNKYYPGRLAGAYNVLEYNDNMYDDVGHGTHIAGTIAEATPDNVKILPVKISVTNDMYLSDIIAGTNYVTYGKKADVMNMSFGSFEYSQGEYNSIEAAKQENIISVAAAGNENTSDQSYPASYVNTISVAAVDSTKTKASFSNYGGSINFSAPGVNIKSLVREGSMYSSREGEEGWDGDPDFELMSGTSMAAPHVVAAVANLKSLNKNLSLNNTITVLRRYTEDLGDSGWDEIYGYGFIDFTDADVCDGQDCDEYNVFKESEHDNLAEVYVDYEIEPMLSAYDYGSISNILGTKVKVNYTNDKVIEYRLCDIKNLIISEYDSNSKSKQTINISFTTPLGVVVNDSFDVTNPADYESVWEYELVGDNNIEITDFKDESFSDNSISFIGESLYIPETIDGYTVTGIADMDDTMFDEWKWNYFAKVKNLYLPSSLTRIGNNAFSNKTIIGSSVTYLPGKLKTVRSEAESLSIGDNAFRSQGNLYDLDGTVSYVGDYAFSGASSLHEINFSDDITHIGKGAFQWAMNSRTITIPQTITEIGEEAFAGYSISRIIFLNDMDGIPTGMFRNSWNLESLILPDGVKEIGDYAFYHCESLVSIRLPRNLTTIGNNAFEGAFKQGSNTKTYIFENVESVGNDTFKDIASDAKLYVYNNSYIKSYANTNNVSYVQIDPDTVTVHGINSQYHAFDSIDVDNVSIELTYNEKTTRTEFITSDIDIEYPDSRESLRYGDTSVIISTYNRVDYYIEEDVQIEVLKAIPEYTVPTGLSAELGQVLSEVDLPLGFEWMNSNQKINKSGVYKARFIPSDTVNYETVENIDILIRLTNEPFTLYDYTVDEINDMFSDVGPNTELNSFTSKIILGYGYGIEVDSKEVNGKNVVYTGAKVRITHGLDLYKEYTISVKGDLNNDGMVTPVDFYELYELRKKISNNQDINIVYKLAGDLNNDELITPVDIFNLYDLKKSINMN